MVCHQMAEIERKGFQIILSKLLGLNFSTTSCLKPAQYLSKFPCDADSPAEAVATNEQSLHGPASKVAKGKYVKMAQDPLPRYHCAIYSIFLEKWRLTGA